MGRQRSNPLTALASRPSVIAAGLFLVTVFVFWPATRCDFVHYDDPDYVSANRHVQQGLTRESVRWAFTTSHASNWHPLTWLSHMLDYQLFGPTPRGHHATSVLLHGLNAALAFLVFRQWTGSVGRSVVVTGFFALHPLRVESVAWISERKDVLSGMFFLLSLWAYGRFAQRHKAAGASGEPVSAPGAAGRPLGHSASVKWRLPAHWIWYFVCFVAFALGLMSKPMLVTLPFVLLLADFGPLNRWPRPVQFPPNRPALPRADAAAPPRSLGRLWVEKIPFFVLAAGSSVVTFVAQRQGGAVAPLGGLPLATRLENAVVSYARYLGKFFWPTNLSVLYPHPGDWPDGQVLAAVLVLLAVTAVVLHRAARWPFALTGWFWFLGMLVPVIGLVQVGIQSMADRYTYLPQIGLVLALVWGVAEGLKRWRLPPAATATGAGLILCVCAVLARQQLAHWRDTETLFRHAVKVTRGNYLAHNNLGYFLALQGKLDEAMEEYRRALESNPRYEEALNNLGHALARKRRHAEAITYYEAALRVRPDHVEVHNNLGNALSELGRLEEAIAHYQFVLMRQPDHADAHNNLGIALAIKGDFPRAVHHLSEALRLKPDYAGARSNLGNALAAQGRHAEAIAEYQKAIALNPNDAQAHNNLGNALAETGNLPAAVASYRRALHLQSDNPEAHFNLGMALLRLGQVAEAKSHFLAAIRLRPDYAPAIQQLQALERAGPQP